MIAILHPGEMGTAVGACLRANGHDVGWLPAGRSAATARRAREAGFTELDSLDGVDMLISLCPPDSAHDVARSVGAFSGTYVDANAVSPQHSRELSADLADFVDASVIGPPPVRSDTTRLYLSGGAARGIAALFAGSALTVTVLDEPFAASALKMSYAAWTKISSALLLASYESAQRAGVGAALAHEWSLSQPNLADRLAAATDSATRKGWRWTGEMREIAATFEALGLPAGFGQAAAQIFGGYERPSAGWGPSRRATLLPARPSYRRR